MYEKRWMVPFLVIALVLLSGCTNGETPSTDTETTTDPKEGGTDLVGPGPGPIISVGPRPGGTGSSYTSTSWKMGDPGSERDVAFGESMTLRTDVRNLKLQFFAREGDKPDLALSKLTLEIEGKTLVVELSSGDLVWTLDGEELAECDNDSKTSEIKDCEGDGIPPEFDGDIDGIELDPVGGLDLHSIRAYMQTEE